MEKRVGYLVASLVFLTFIASSIAFQKTITGNAIADSCILSEDSYRNSHNLVQNPGFEQGLDGWTLNSNYKLDQGDPTEGSQSINVWTGGWLIMKSDYIEIDPTKRYELSFDAKSTGGEFDIGWQEFDKDYVGRIFPGGGREFVIRNGNLTSDWQEYSQTVVPAVDTKYVKIMIISRNTNASFDNIKLTSDNRIRMLFRSKYKDHENIDFQIQTRDGVDINDLQLDLNVVDENGDQVFSDTISNVPSNNYHYTLPSLEVGKYNVSASWISNSENWGTCEDQVHFIVVEKPDHINNEVYYARPYHINGTIMFTENDISPESTQMNTLLDSRYCLDQNSRSIGIDLKEINPVKKILLNSDAYNQRLTSNQLEIYYSNDNQAFTRYTGNINEETKEVTYWNLPSYTSISLTDLSFNARYIKIVQPYSDSGNCVFENDVTDILRVYNSTELEPTMLIRFYKAGLNDLKLMQEIGIDYLATDKSNIEGINEGFGRSPVFIGWSSDHLQGTHAGYLDQMEYFSLNHAVNLFTLTDEPAVLRSPPAEHLLDAYYTHRLNSPLPISYGAEAQDHTDHKTVENDYEHFYIYSNSKDVLADDSYDIVSQWGDKSWLEIAATTDAMVKQARGIKPIALVTAVGWYRGQKETNMHEIRFSTYLALIHGSKNFYYYSFTEPLSSDPSDWYLPTDRPEIWNNFKPLVNELRFLEDVILFGQENLQGIDISASNESIIYRYQYKPLHYTIKDYGNYRYLFMTNAFEKDLIITVNSAENFCPEAEIMFKEETVNPTSFTRTLAPYGVEIIKFRKSSAGCSENDIENDPAELEEVTQLTAQESTLEENCINCNQEIDLETTNLTNIENENKAQDLIMNPEKIIPEIKEFTKTNRAIIAVSISILFALVIAAILWGRFMRGSRALPFDPDYD